MEQTNAFELLGATPSDTIETLQELLDEKELLSDDVAAVQSAYADLTNPKKRLIHEITYFYKDDLTDFLQLTTKELEEKPTIAETSSILVNLGKWFEEKIRVKSTEFDDEFDLASLFDDSNEEETPKIENDALIKINNARLSIHMSIVDEDSLKETITVLKNEYVNFANEFLDKLQENTVVRIFNNIVKSNDYESFFVDELIAHYELIISESLQKKENECRDSFESIEKSSSSFNNGSPLSPYLKTQISEFEKKLKSWDNYAQPLQVNMQRHGGQHEASEQLLRDLRNKVIDLCNKSQEVLGRMLDRWNNAMKQYDFSTAQNIKKQINNKIPDSLGLVEGLISIINIFQSVFAELDIDSERLAKDKKDLSGLKKSLAQLNESAQVERNKQLQKEQVSKNCRIAHGVFAIISFIIKNCRIAHGVFAIISFIIMIICFACGSIGGGIAFTIITGAFGICCVAYPNLEGRNIMKWIIIIGVILGCCIGPAVSSSSSKSSSSTSKPEISYSTTTTSYTITFNKDGGSGGSSSVSAKKGQSMPYATAPTKKGYTFGGYFTSRNGQGTKYYSSSMSSSRSWDKTTNVTLYAYWIEDDDGIKLTSSNFETYFNFSSSCSVTRSSYNSYGTATYSFSISPKSTFRYSSNSDNPSSITVTIGLDISSISTSYGTPSKYKITITLYKASGYSYSGTRTYSVGSYERYWIDGIYSVDGKIYK